jgi:hypothetical protein
MSARFRVTTLLIAIAALAGLSNSPAGAYHYGVGVWSADPMAIRDADPTTGSANALLSDGLGDYHETPDTFGHFHDYAPNTHNYDDYFVLMDQRGTKRTTRLNIPGVTGGTVGCGSKLLLYMYAFQNAHWFNDLAPGQPTFAYGYMSCWVTDGLIFDISYPKSTWCLTIRRTDVGIETVGKTFEFSAPEGCLANVTRMTKTGRDTWETRSFTGVSAPFDVGAVVSRYIKTS